MLAVYWCRHRNTVNIFGIDVVVSIKAHSTGYRNQKPVIYYIPSTEHLSDNKGKLIKAGNTK